MDTITQETPAATEPVLFERDLRGLVKGVEYKFKKSGYRTVIDWRKMILPEHLVFNKQYQKEIEDKYGKSLDQLNVTEVEDRYLLILLPGIKELIALRGFSNLDVSLDKVERDHCAATCRITWIPNFESCGEFISFSDGAGASIDNTNGFGQLFLETIAINRSVVRCARNFLGINIVGQDEVGGKQKFNKIQNESQTTPFSSNALLEQRLVEKGVSFETFRKRVTEAYMDKLSKDANPQLWSNFADLKSIDATSLLEVIKP